jgi:hypothetical protein
MGLRLLAASPILERQQLVRERQPLERGHGHAHFWQRAAAHSRRGFLQAGATLAAGLAIPSMLRASVEHPLPNSIPGGLDLSATAIFFMCTYRGPRLNLPPLRTSMASSARPRFLATGLAEGQRRQRARPLCLTRTCGSWTANTLEETGTTIKAHLRSFESTSTWGGLPPTSVIRCTILIRVWTMVCSGRFQLTRAA